MNGTGKATTANAMMNPGPGDPANPGQGPIYRWGNPGTGWVAFGQRLMENGPTGPVDKGVWSPFVFQ